MSADFQEMSADISDFFKNVDRHFPKRHFKWGWECRDSEGLKTKCRPTFKTLSTVITKLGLKVVPHPHPYRVAWINSSALEVKQRCLVLIDFGLYKDKIWCNIVTINVGHVILGRPWLDDRDVTIYDRSNMCYFEHEGKKIKLLPREPKAEPSESKPAAVKKTNSQLDYCKGF